MTIPNSVTSIGNEAFSGCSSLVSITVNSGNREYSSANDVLFNNDGTKLINYPPSNAQTSYTIPDSVTFIKSYAFEGCSSLTSITIPNSVTFIGDGAFFGCSSLEKVIFNGKEEPEDIGDDIFSNTKVKKINVPTDYKKNTFCGIDIEKPNDPNNNNNNNESSETIVPGYYFEDGILIYLNLSENRYEVMLNPLPGYYVNKNESESYIKCTNSGCETIKKPDESKSCSSNYDGYLIYNNESGVGLCTKINEIVENDNINIEHYTIIPFANTETSYLVHHAIDGEVFNFDRKTDNVYYVVKSNKEAIMFNPEISEKDHCADKDGKLMDRVTDFCSNESSGMYYNCVNGKCTSEYQTEIGKFEDNGEKECICTGTTASENCKNNSNAVGYYLSGTDLYEYKSGESECIKVDNPKDGYYWNSHQYNKLVMCTKSLCSTFTPKLKAAITDNSDYESQFVDSGYNLIFNGESLSSILSKSLDKYEIDGNSDSVFNDPTKTYSIKVNKNSAIIDESEEELIDIPTDAKPGYYKIGKTNKYYQCNNVNGCTETPIATECNASSIGKLFTNDEQVALCLNFFNNKPIWINFENSSSKYLLKYNENNNVFGLSNNQYGLIVVTNNSITLSEESKDNLYIHYRYTDENQKVLTKNGCVADAINEFKIVEGEKNVYTLSCVENDNTGLCKK